MTVTSGKITVTDKLRALCREKGLKATRQRIEIFKVVSAATDHPSVEVIYRRVKKKLPAISFDTVYRTLTSLEENKVISRVHYLDDKTRYDPDTREHHHFICIECKRVFDFQWPDFSALRLPREVPQFGQIHQKYAEIRGLCPKCSKSY